MVNNNQSIANTLGEVSKRLSVLQKEGLGQPPPAPPSGGRTGLSPVTGSGLDDMRGFMETNLEPQTRSIMDAYREARGHTTAAGDAYSGYLSGELDAAKTDLIATGERTLTGAQESQTGFARSPLALSMIGSDVQKAIQAKEKQIGQLELAGRFEEASAMSKLVVEEQTALSNARVRVLDEFFNIRADDRAEKSLGIQEGQFGIQQDQNERDALSFRTPEQLSVLTMAQNFPDAGITESDSMSTVQAKVMNSPGYKNATDLQRAQIDAQLASTASSRASTARTLSEMGGDTSGSDIPFEAGEPLFDAYNIANNLLNDVNLDSILGNIEGRKPDWMLSGEQISTTSQLDQLINTLTVAARGAIKGQGAISDAETAMLASAQTALKRTMSETAARKEIRKVKGVIGLQAGIPQIVTLSKDGESQTINITRDGFNQAVADGFQVAFE